ncbi:UDP-N-acetylmuramoyl-L-alanine--D-glutamate ligase [Leptotrichia sp. oral taxon 221]|uniref:UDP-N-acetylmuramoyl-L-alanine--D-glutamate ligase n=1 Tax=Leptotrichia sp. oral taxon 221 TaxID=712362 RepID=UPI001B8B4B0D|nr:UDP-N-acetylmuramoyl-L-alanine--D-glutamate ligase [Leptotrichia sp. oral taxon 221]QUB97215.1 UDP-N-acetylmuramoyl-L-alanine--D-glutamate ligase [Leptotrichia sp. oral taxon 221]
MEKALVFGAGLSGLGAKELLEKKGYEVYLIDDKVAKTSKEGIEILNNKKIEFIVKSPGIPWKAELLQVAKEKNVQVISEIDLAYKYMDKNIKVFSITGTNGKTTTATKIYELLDFAGYKARLAGNAGFSFAKLVADEEPLEYVVLELSSYQLENNPQIHSNIAGIINLTPDHLTRYKTVEDYYITKFNIFSKQTEDDFALINLDDPVFLGLAEREEIKSLMKAKNVYLSKEKKGNIFVYNNEIRIMNDLADRAENLSESEILEKSRFLIKVEDLALKGVHNLENMLFLIGVATIVKVPDEKVVEFLSSTKALEHRLENFFVKGNTTFINDSKGTNVESTLKAIDSFNNDIIMILGGDDKKIDNTELVKRIAEKVERVYLIGDNAPLLIDDMEKINYKNYKNLETLENVLNYIKENEDFEKDQTILFSPATSSFCQFRSFEHRGKVFKELTVKILGN